MGGDKCKTFKSYLGSYLELYKICMVNTTEATIRPITFSDGGPYRVGAFFVFFEYRGVQVIRITFRSDSLIPASKFQIEWS